MNIEDFRNLLQADRSIRIYKETPRVTPDQARCLVALTRCCASGRNLQPLKYRIVTSGEECAKIFPLLAWAGYYKDWAGPAVGERPTAYLVLTVDTRLAQDAECDAGIQMQAITLGARAMGLGACIIKSFNPDKVVETLGLPEWAKPLYIISLGAPDEESRIGDVKDGDIKYYRESQKKQVVPKRSPEELII